MKVEPASAEFAFRAYEGDSAEERRKKMIGEAVCSLIVNGQEWVTFFCTPSDLDFLAIGFLFDAGVIESADEVEEVRVTGGPQDLEALVEVSLRDKELTLPSRSTLTTGCGGGLTFYDIAAKRSPLASDREVTPAQVYAAMRQLMAANAELHREVGGFHSAALSDGEELLIVAHDVGRHNTVDRVAGAALCQRIATRDRLLVTTGRVSTEMLAKAARLQVPVVISRNSPTGLATNLAREWRIAIAGYVRGQRMHVYSSEERIVSPLPQVSGIGSEHP
jgi:FdhD protein